MYDQKSTHCSTFTVLDFVLAGILVLVKYETSNLMYEKTRGYVHFLAARGIDGGAR
jgi:hypothetical protein